MRVEQVLHNQVLVCSFYYLLNLFDYYQGTFFK